MSIMGAAAAVTGIVMAGKAAVQVYADIDAEMASVRKFTGMTTEEVEKLNEQFKKIDTRTSREEWTRWLEWYMPGNGWLRRSYLPRLWRAL